MEMPVNRLKRALAGGQLQIGLWSTLASHIAAEVSAGSGFDWLLLDIEHAPNDVSTVHRQLQAMTGQRHVRGRPSRVERSRRVQAAPRHRRAKPAGAVRPER